MEDLKIAELVRPPYQQMTTDKLLFFRDGFPYFSKLGHRSGPVRPLLDNLLRVVQMLCSKAQHVGLLVHI